MTKSKSLSRYAAAVCASFVLGATCAHAGSIGKTITVESRLPDAVTVNPGFTSTSVIGVGGTSFAQPDYVVSITDNAVSFAGWSFPNAFVDYAFNGTVLKTAGRWSGYGIDPSSNLAGFSLDRITVVGGELRVNFQGLSVDTGTRLALNVSAVPEPETYAMLLAGVGMVGLARRRGAAARADRRAAS
nr:PEP-CTERM sorting domain-containing protein [uncultured Duganella sp.]